MIKHLHAVKTRKSLRKADKMTHKIDASNGLHIMQNIPAHQLDELEKTYVYMLEAIREAKKAQAASRKQTAEVVKFGQLGLIKYNRRCLLIACLRNRGVSFKDIDAHLIHPNGYCLNRTMAEHGRALKKQKLLKAKTDLILKLVKSGHGIRPTARAIPAALGACSPSLVCKIVKADKLRQQVPLPFPLAAV